jgi:hypothetical protein
MTALARTSSNSKRQAHILISEMLDKDYNRKCSVEKKNTARGSQAAWRQDELIGGKSPVVK